MRTRGRGRGKDFLRLGVPFFYVCDTAALSCWLFVLLNCLTEALYAPRKRYLLPTLPVIPPDHKSSPLAALTRCYNGAYRFPPSGISRTIGSVGNTCLFQVGSETFPVLGLRGGFMVRNFRRFGLRLVYQPAFFAPFRISLATEPTFGPVALSSRWSGSVLFVQLPYPKNLRHHLAENTLPAESAFFFVYAVLSSFDMQDHSCLYIFWIMGLG